MKICLDTQIFAWAICERCTPGQEDDIKYGKLLLEQVRKDGHEIILPSVVVGELLTGLPLASHTMAINLLDIACTCVPFDVGCAGRFAQLWQSKKDSGIIKKLKDDEGAKRHELKADCLIVATAIQNNVDIIYSNDRKLRLFAEGSVTAKDLPKPIIQEVLFDQQAN